MSFQGGLGSMSTLAHEIGHSMHSWLSQQAQASSVPRYTLFAAEVASNFNQAMVRHHLFEHNTDPDFEVALIEEAVSNFHRYFFIMPTLARFESEIHRRIEAGESLSAPALNTLMADLLQDGYGQGVTIDRERSGITWGEFSTHLYANFYAYQYATGISAAHQLRAGFDADPEGARGALPAISLGRRPARPARRPARGGRGPDDCAAGGGDLQGAVGLRGPAGGTAGPARPGDLIERFPVPYSSV